MSQTDLEKIVCHYNAKSEKPRVIKAGAVLYLTNNRQDAMMEFVGINDKDELKALLNSVKQALEFGILSYDKAQEVEKGMKK
jgi:hypothetical protein